MKYLTVIFAASLMIGCASPTVFNIKSTDSERLSQRGAGTYSDYGSGVKIDQENGLTYINVFTGGAGDCSGAVYYAKPKLDDYMNKNGFSSYLITKGEYTLFPLSGCKLFVKFDK